MPENKFKITLIVLLVVITLLTGYIAFGMYKVVKALPTTLLAEEVLGKLYAHNELEQYRDTKPQALVQITPNNVESLAQQIPGLDASYVGAFAVGFADRIVLYDYSSDTILANIPLPKQAPQNLEAVGQAAPKQSTTTVQSVK